MIVILGVLSPVTVRALPLEEEMAESISFEESLAVLGEDTRSLLEKWGISEDRLLEQKESPMVWAVVKELLVSSVKNPLSAFSNGLLILLLGWIAAALIPQDGFGTGPAVHYAVCLCFAGAVLIPMSYSLEKAASAVSEIGQFMLAFLPIYAGVLLLAGHSMTASGTTNLVFGCAQVVVAVADRLLTPVLGMFTALVFCQSISGQINTSGFALAIKRALTWLLGLAGTIFSAVIAMAGMSNGSADSVAQRAGRFFIGNMVPVIGGTLSEAMGSLHSYAGVLKNSSGVFGVTVLLAVLLPCLVETLLWRFFLMLLTGVAQLNTNSSLLLLIRSLEEGMGLLSAIIICCLIMFGVSFGVLIFSGG